MTVTPILLITIALAIALGWTGHSLFGRPKKRKQIPNGSALQKQPEATWAKWDPSFGEGLKR